MKKTALNKLIGILIITLLLGTSYTIVIASDGTQSVPDEEPPQITNIIADPSTQTENGPVNISCTVIDNVLVQQVTVNITYPDATEHNETMIYNNQSDSAYFNTTYEMIGNYTFYIWATDNSSNHNQSESYQFTIEEGHNQVPNMPSNPFPADGALNVPLDSILTWEGGDPDGDMVYYDIFFGVNVSPPLLIENQENTSYDPELQPNTLYYWVIWATDEHGAVALGPTWSFTTTTTGNVTVEITFPTEGGTYRNDKPLFGFPRNRIIAYGPIVIKADATADVGIDKVFLLANDIEYGSADDTAPYEFIFRRPLSGPVTLKVKAVDNDANVAYDEIQIFKWRIHPALIAAGALVGLKGIANIAQGKPAIGWTIIRGTAINIKEQNNDLVFRAFRLHFTEITGSSFSSGILRLKKVKISDVGLNRMITLGPFGSFSYIFAICQGGLREV